MGMAKGSVCCTIAATLFATSVGWSGSVWDDPSMAERSQPRCVGQINDHIFILHENALFPSKVENP